MSIKKISVRKICYECYTVYHEHVIYCKKCGKKLIEEKAYNRYRVSINVFDYLGKPLKKPLKDV